MSRNWFPLTLGLIVTAICGLFLVTTAVSAPAGTRWLGDTMQFPSDTAVYLSYIRQGQSGAFALRNLYAAEPHATRIDPVWSAAGLLARIGVSPIVVHEALRALFIVLLAFAVTAAARSVANTERDARLGAWLAFGGVGFGWAYSLWVTANNAWTIATPVAADVATPFAIAPSLLGGAHLILSTALLVTSARLIWRAWETHEGRTLGAAVACSALLVAFHPYYLPTLAIISALSALRHRAALQRIDIVRGIALSCLAILPACAIYLPLAFDDTFREHHLVINVLTLPPLLSWPLTLLPFIIALLWQWKKRVSILPRAEWLVAWIIAASVCMFLPFPWRMKYLEGLGIALVLLTLPTWIVLRQWARGITLVALGLAASLTPLHLAASQLAWISGPPDRTQWFYAPTPVFAAWEHLAVTAPTSAIILTDAYWYNIWTPTYTNRTIWLGHDHETPDFFAKRDAWRELFSTQDATRARALLDATPVTHLVLTTPETRARFSDWLALTWATTYVSDGVLILERLDP